MVSNQPNKGQLLYTKNLDLNLFEPLTSKVISQFSKGDGSEIRDTPNKAAKMRALHSSSALAVNVFQYWQHKKKIHEIAYSCGLCNRSDNSQLEILFEEKFSISPNFQFAPNLDVIIKNADNSIHKIYAIECKFSEAYSSFTHKGIDAKYLILSNLWKDIPNLFSFSKSLCPTDNEYKYLNPGQLIKHILGLKKVHGKNAFKLLYLWYDVLGEEGYRHQMEINSFRDILVRDRLNFTAISYQNLISNMQDWLYKDNERYFDYLTDRYL